MKTKESTSAYAVDIAYAAPCASGVGEGIRSGHSLGNADPFTADRSQLVSRHLPWYGPATAFTEDASPMMFALSISDDALASATDSLITPQRDWLPPALKRITSLSSLPYNWDSYGAGAPNTSAIEASRLVLQVLAIFNVRPSSIDPSAEGGICISFSKHRRYGDIECFNNGEVLAVTSADDSAPKVWSVGLSTVDIAQSAQRILRFINL